MASDPVKSRHAASRHALCHEKPIGHSSPVHKPVIDTLIATTTITTALVPVLAPGATTVTVAAAAALVVSLVQLGPVVGFGLEPRDEG